MKLGYLTTFSPEEPARAKRLGFDCLEIHSASWHGNQVFNSASERQKILDDLKRAKDDHNISISAIAHYGPALHLKGKDLLDSYTKACDLAQASGANIVTAIPARENPDKPVSENLAAYKSVYTEVAKIAQDHNTRIAFENWPNFRGYPWKGGTMASTPDAWEQLFNTVPSESLGLEFDPSHLFWQGIDHIAALKKFSSRVYHAHAKDTEIFQDRRNHTGIFGENWWTYRIPGLGAINWAEFLNELHTLGYKGALCIEHEDHRFDGNRQDPTPARFEQGLRIGLSTLRPLAG